MTLLGIVALVDGQRAYRFLRQFAQTIRANTIEALCRFAVGLAFLHLAEELPTPIAFRALGLILAVSASAMLALPRVHKKFADKVLPAVERMMPLIGIVSLIAGVALGIMLWSLQSVPCSPY